MLIFVVNITLALILFSSIDIRLSVSDIFRFCASLTSEMLEFLETAGIMISFLGICFSQLSLCLLTGTFSAKIWKTLPGQLVSSLSINLDLITCFLYSDVFDLLVFYLADL